MKKNNREEKDGLHDGVKQSKSAVEKVTLEVQGSGRTVRSLGRVEERRRGREEGKGQGKEG